MNRYDIRPTLMAAMASLLIGMTAHAQIPNEIVGRPGDSSVTVSVMFATETDLYLSFGTQSGNHPLKTSVTTASPNVPVEIRRDSLLPGKRYFFRTWYRAKNSGLPFTAGMERSFMTQRKSGEAFSFVVEADPHLDSNTIPASYRATLQHMLTKRPDFLVDLGDNFMTDKMPVITEQTIREKNLLYRDYWSELCNNSALFVALGNHEGELGWLPDTGPTSLPSMAANLRKTYVPNPFPEGIYTGNTVASPNVGLRENYYAWEWGDALFVVIDPYIYTKAKPGWGWTLGKDQYEWLKTTLRNSRKPFKFIFSHQVVGGSGTEGRGGVEVAHLYEMGGRNADSSWGFSANRPGWEKPIHQLMVETGVSVFFHGHDHFYGRQMLDNVIYQEVPQPSARNLTTVTGLAYGYTEGTLLPSRGYILVTVGPDSIKADYVRTYLPNEENATRKNGDIAHSYTIKKSPVTGLPMLTESSLVRIYPNPTTSLLMLEVPGIRPTRMEYLLVDGQGRLLKKGMGDKVDTHDLPPGTYTLQVRTERFWVNRKVVVGR